MDPTSKSYQNKTVKANSSESIFSEIQAASCHVIGVCSSSDANSSKPSLTALLLLKMALIGLDHGHLVSDNFFTTNPFLDSLPFMTSKRHAWRRSNKSVDLRNNAENNTAAV